MTLETIKNATVQPQDPERLTFHDVYTGVRKNIEVGGIGCLFALVWLAICILSFVVLSKTDWPSQTHWLLWMSPFVVASWLTAGAVDAWKDYRAKQDALGLVERENKENVATAKQDAERAAQYARWDYERSLKLLENLRADVWLAAESISKANFEYSANAASLYWDYIEKTASHIAAFGPHYQELLDCAESYERHLMGRVHTFPPFSIAKHMIPDIRKPVADFQKTLRLGQTNSHFTVIWEQIRTREVLIEDFRTLNEAVQSIPASIDQSLARMEQRLEQVIREGARNRCA